MWLWRGLQQLKDTQMPTYEYECEKCGRVFEEFQSITAEPVTRCRFEGCDGTVRRLLSGGAGFLFKGSGFYITDYRSNSYKEKAKAEKSSSSTAGPPSSGTSSSTGSSSSSTSASSAKSSD